MKEIGDVLQSQLGHSRDITPLLTSLASSKGFDICTAEGVVIVGVVIANSTDTSGFTTMVGNFAIDLVVPP